jgi:hypothetical protein
LIIQVEPASRRSWPTAAVFFFQNHLEFGAWSGDFVPVEVVGSMVFMDMTIVV